MSVLVALHRMDALLQHLPDDDAWLSAAERARLAQISHPQRRAQYRAGHALARQLLVQQGGAEAADWALDRDVHGAPQVLCKGQPAALHVSLSHSGAYLACAVAPWALGVDIECPQRQRDVLSLAESLYPPAFLQQLQQADATARHALFFQRWTLDEAQAKASGRGLQIHRLKHHLWQPEAGLAQAWAGRFSEGWLALCSSTPICAGSICFQPADIAAQCVDLQGWRRESLPM